MRDSGVARDRQLTFTIAKGIMLGCIGVFALWLLYTRVAAWREQARMEQAVKEVLAERAAEEKRQEATSRVQSGPVYPITIEQLCDGYQQDYTANPVRAEQTWLGKTFRLQGQIADLKTSKDIFLDWGDDLRVTLKGLQDARQEIVVIMPRSGNEAAFARLSREQVITVRGDLKAWSSHSLYLSPAAIE